MSELRDTAPLSEIGLEQKVFIAQESTLKSKWSFPGVRMVTATLKEKGLCGVYDPIMSRTKKRRADNSGQCH